MVHREISASNLLSRFVSESFAVLIVRLGCLGFLWDRGGSCCSSVATKLWVSSGGGSASDTTVDAGDALCTKGEKKLIKLKVGHTRYSHSLLLSSLVFILHSNWSTWATLTWHWACAGYSIYSHSPALSQSCNLLEKCLFNSPLKFYN